MVSVSSNQPQDAPDFNRRLENLLIHAKEWRFSHTSVGENARTILELTARLGLGHVSPAPAAVDGPFGAAVARLTDWDGGSGLYTDERKLKNDVRQIIGDALRLARELAGYNEDWRALYEALGLSREETDAKKIAVRIHELVQAEADLAKAEAVIVTLDEVSEETKCKILANQGLFQAFCMAITRHDARQAKKGGKE